MYHDFDTKHGVDGDPGNTGNWWDSTNACNKQGIMSYGNWDLAKWSTCSVNDFKEHYEANSWGNGCLDDITSATTTATGMNKCRNIIYPNISANTPA